MPRIDWNTNYYEVTRRQRSTDSINTSYIRVMQADSGWNDIYITIREYGKMTGGEGKV